MTDGSRAAKQGFAVPLGAPPNPAELRLWARGELSAQRHAEVKSHISLDNKTFDAAMDAYSEHQNNSTPSRGWAQRGFVPLALAASLVLVVSLQFVNNTPELSGEPVLRSGAASYLDSRAAALRLGFTSEQTIGSDALCNKADCSTQELMRLYGNTLQTVLSRCNTSTGPIQPATAANLNSLVERFAANAELAIWQSDLAAIDAATSQNDQATACALSRKVIATYL